MILNKDFAVAHNNTPSLIALAVAAGLVSPAFAADKKTDEVMVVSGSRMEQKLEDVSGPIAVITSEQIEEQVVSNVADLFRYEPGVSVQGGGDAQTFTIRGMSENRVKVVQDGVRQNDAYKNGGVGQTYFDTDMIKQVEVAKGPASAAYGSDALGASSPSPPRMPATSSREGQLPGRDHWVCLQQPPEDGRHHRRPAHRRVREPVALHLA